MSITTREQLNKTAEELRGKLDLKGDNSVILMANVNSTFAKFVKFTSEEHTDDEISIAAKPVKAAIALYNDEQRMLRLESISKMKYPDAVADFTRSQTVEGVKLVRDKKAGEWSVDPDKDVPISAWDFLTIVCPTEINGIVDAVSIFMDNCAKVNFNDIEKTVVNRTGLSEGYIAMRKRMGWEITDLSKSGKGTLMKQLNELVARIFRVDLTMLKADLKWITTTIFITKDSANQAGKFVQRNEETCVNALFRAMYTRINQLPYDWQNDTNGEKNPKTVAANKTMGEEEPKAGKPAEVTGEKVTVKK